MRKLSEIWFLRTAGMVFILTGLAKTLGAFGKARVLAMPDPLLGLAFSKLMLATGVVELVVAFICLSKARPSLLKTGLVAWMATNFLVYRIGLWAIGWHHPCSCMGSLAGALHLSDRAADNIMKGVLAFLLVGSYLLLYLDWRARRAAGPPASPPPQPAELLPA